MSAPTIGEVSKLIGVRDVPQAARSLATISDPDYIDLFTVTTSLAADKSVEEWARAALEQAPLARRNARLVWRLMGLRLGPRHSTDHVQGWRIGARGDNWLRLETESWYLTARAVCIVDNGQVSLSLALRYDRSVAARGVWSLVSGPHQRAVPIMLRQAVQLVARA